MTLKGPEDTACELHVDVRAKLFKLLYPSASSARRVQEQCFGEARDIAIANDASF